MLDYVRQRAIEVLKVPRRAVLATSGPAGVQVFTALISGAIVDRFGRRLTLFISDLLCWSIPCFIWAFAQDVRYVIVAALLNSLWRISHTAWTCLMVEDAETRHLVHIWTWIMIFAFSSAFFAPVGGWFVAHYGLIPAMRGLLLFGFIMLTAKGILLYIYSHETGRGIQRKTRPVTVPLSVCWLNTAMSLDKFCTPVPFLRRYRCWSL